MSRKLTTEEWKEKARSVHGDRYDYSLVEYVYSTIKVKIICYDHGIFEQSPKNHLKGTGCPSCAGNKTSNTEEFIEKAREVHGDRYDYSLVEYINSETKVKIICYYHGIFEQSPNNHLKGTGCPSCGVIKKAQSISSNTEEWKEKARARHGDRYDYSLVEYANSYTKIKIICSEHGVFEQEANSHLNGRGCPSCANIISRQELELVEFIKTIYDGRIITNTRAVITPYELDIYLPKIKLALEYNGTYWHEEGVNKPIGYHNMKTNLCKTMGIDLIHVWERDWTSEKREWVESYIKRVI